VTARRGGRNGKASPVRRLQNKLSHKVNSDRSGIIQKATVVRTKLTISLPVTT